jgi:hypothetical protein
MSLEYFNAFIKKYLKINNSFVQMKKITYNYV